MATTEPMAPRPVELTDHIKSQLNAVSTATLAYQLQARGIRNFFFSGLKPTRPQRRMVGHALTLRFVPMREDLKPQLAAGFNAQRQAFEGIGPDEVLVIGARSQPDAGTLGDIFATRARSRGAAGIVTDGSLRDTPAVQAIDIPIYHRSAHAGTLGLLHLPLETNVPVACSEVLVMPGDIIVGDAEGAMVIPAALVEEVAEAAAEQELREEFILGRIEAGESTTGLYPLSAERLPEFEKWRAERG